MWFYLRMAERLDDNRKIVIVNWNSNDDRFIRFNKVTL